MRVKKSATIRTRRRYVSRHKGTKHDCHELGCSDKKEMESGCGLWT